MNITERDSDGFYCEQVSFSAPFQSGSTVRVFPSLSHENHPHIANEAAVVMVMSVNYVRFNVCVIEPSQPAGEVTLNWFAFSDNILPQGIQAGSVSYNMFTSGTSCSVVTFVRVCSKLLECFSYKLYFLFTLFVNSLLRTIIKT